MIARFNIGVWFRPALSAVVLSLAGCASTSVQEVTKEETITYKTVDDGTLNVMANNQPYATEQYTIEKGSDGNWTATALVKPAQPEQPTRDVRLELGQNMQPLTYSEETQGASPLKVFISFGADKATVLVKQGSAPEANKEMAGVFDVFLGDGLFHHPALLVRNHVAKNTTTPSEFKLFADKDLKVIVSELEPTTLQLTDKTLGVRHFLVDIAGTVKEHVWVTQDDLRLLKVEIPKAVTATRVEIPETSQLTAVPPPPPAPPMPAAPAEPAKPAAPAKPATSGKK